MSYLRDAKEGVLMEVLAAPRAAKSGLAGVQEGRLKIKLAAPPAGGKANAELIAFLAQLLDLPKSSLSIRSGAGGKRKTILICGSNAERIKTAVEQALK